VSRFGFFWFGVNSEVLQFGLFDLSIYLCTSLKKIFAEINSSISPIISLSLACLWW